MLATPSRIAARLAQRKAEGRPAFVAFLTAGDPSLERTPPPRSPEPLFEIFPGGLTTAEIALLLADGPDPAADVRGTERFLLDLAAGGSLQRTPLGQDAIWRLAPSIVGVS